MNSLLVMTFLSALPSKINSTTQIVFGGFISQFKNERALINSEASKFLVNESDRTIIDEAVLELKNNRDISSKKISLREEDVIISID